MPNYTAALERDRQQHLVRMGKGRYAALKPIDCPAPWRGMDKPSPPPFDAEQVRVNRRLYPHLFTA